MGAKSMSESPYNPVAAALGNALADATGIRFTVLPFKPDRIVSGAEGEVRRKVGRHPGGEPIGWPQRMTEGFAHALSFEARNSAHLG